jgi:hypothetical protein
MEAVKAMIHDQYLPMHMWEEAAKTIVYVKNKSPHKVLENNTPKEIFSGEKSEVIHIRIFGYPVFMHVPKENSTKLDPSGKNGIFVDYSDTSKAYKIYIPSHQKVDISQDVTFDDSASFKKSKQDYAKEVHEEENEVTRVPEVEAVEPKEFIHGRTSEASRDSFSQEKTILGT